MGFLEIDAQKTVTSHLSWCKPKCNKCAYKSIQYQHAITDGEWYDEGLLKCRCWFANRFGEPRPTNPPNGGSWCWVCMRCSSLSREQCLHARRRHDKVMLRKFAKGPLSCSDCSTPLPRLGLRWWFCITCNHECRNGVHRPWI